MQSGIVTKDQAALQEVSARNLIKQAKRMQSSITSKGQTTIPKEVRDRFQLKPGDRIKFFFHPDGSVAILPMLPASALGGMLKPRARPVLLEDMDAGIIEGATARYRRLLNQ